MSGAERPVLIRVRHGALSSRQMGARPRGDVFRNCADASTGSLTAVARFTGTDGTRPACPARGDAGAPGHCPGPPGQPCRRAGRSPRGARRPRQIRALQPAPALHKHTHLAPAWRGRGCGRLASSAAVRCDGAGRKSRCPGPDSSATPAQVIPASRQPGGTRTHDAGVAREPPESPGYGEHYATCLPDPRSSHAQSPLPQRPGGATAPRTLRPALRRGFP